MGDSAIPLGTFQWGIGKSPSPPVRYECFCILAQAKSPLRTPSEALHSPYWTLPAPFSRAFCLLRPQAVRPISLWGVETQEILQCVKKKRPPWASFHPNNDGKCVPQPRQPPGKFWGRVLKYRKSYGQRKLLKNVPKGALLDLFDPILAYFSHFCPFLAFFGQF